METKRHIPVWAMAALLLLSSCVKDELYNTPHPGHAKITVTADWAQRGEGVGIPGSWTVGIGGYTGTETAATHLPDRLFAPGSYTLAAYSPADGITVSGTTATVDAVGGFISNAPGWLFTHVQAVTVEADTDYEFTATMRQQTRELTLLIEPEGDAAGRIEAIEGRLSGVAGTLDFATGTHGAPSDIELHFTKITDGDDAGKWTATVRLLGIAGGTQRLAATLTYTGGNPADTSLDSDLTAALAGFNDDKAAPLTLGGTMVETPTEAGVSAEITGWETVDGGNVDVEM